MGRVYFQRGSRFVGAVLAICLSACAPKKTEPISVLDQVKSDLCDKQVVLLGETGTHGDGATEQFKSDLIPKLVDDCGFDLVLFEAPFYEFAKLNRALDQGQAIERADLARAIGGLWKDDQEIQGLITYLTAEANAGTVRVAGLDDQMRQRGQDYAYGPMFEDVVTGLGPKEAVDCEDLLGRMRDGNFNGDDPYTLQKLQRIPGCFSSASDDFLIEGLRSNIRRYFARDFDRKNYFSGRAKSMFANFEFWFDAKDTPPKTIIWTATVHAAKARGQLKGRPNMGTFIHQRFGDQAFVLGFSALSGQYRKIRADVLDVPQAPENSIEYQAMSTTKNELVYLNNKDLVAYGKAPASIYSYKYATDDWSDILDGLVIFREQRPTAIIEE